MRLTKRHPVHLISFSAVNAAGVGRFGWSALLCTVVLVNAGIDRHTAFANAAAMSRSSQQHQSLGAPTGSAPTLVSSTYLGSSYNNATSGITLDNEGNLYVCGFGRLTDPAFPAPTFLGPCDDTGGYLAKFDPTGAPVFVTYLGGSHNNALIGIAIDQTGALCVAGATSSPDFPVVAPPLFSNGFTGFDLFVAKLAPDGQSIVYSALLGNVDQGNGGRLALDATGAVYLTGTTQSDDFPIVGGFQSEPGGYRDAFVVKIEADGSRVAYSSLLGGIGFDQGWDIAVDASGRAFVTGWTSDSTGFPIVNPALPVIARQRDEVFVTVVSADGGSIVSSSILGGQKDDRAFAIALDAAGDAYVTGSADKGFPVRNAFQRDQKEFSGEAFLAKLRISPSSTDIVYSTYLGGTSSDVGYAVAVGPDQAPVVAGLTVSRDFPLSRALQSALAIDPQFSQPDEDLFISRFSPSGQSLTFSTYFGGKSSDLPDRVAVSNTGEIFVSGSTNSKDFPIRRAIQSEFGDVSRHGILVRISPVRPPTIKTTLAIEKPGKPLRIRIKGSDFEPGVEVYVDGDDLPWPGVRLKGSATLTLTGGDELAARFPVGVRVLFRLRNPDGGQVYGSLTR